MPPERVRLGYVAKVFPRLSETFVVNEILSHEAAGTSVEVFSLRPSSDVGAHAAHARLQAPVTTLPDRVTVGALLDEAAACGEFASLEEVVEHARELAPRELFHALLIARAVRERGITHLHAHFANVAAVVARLAATLAGVPFSLTCHAKDIFCDDVDEAALGDLLGAANAVVTVSDFNVDDLCRRHPHAAPRIHRVYNGIELEHFPFAPPTERPRRIIGVGRLVEKKGFDDLLRACAILRDQGRAAPCRLVGTGVDEPALLALRDQLGLGGLVEFVGAASQEQVRAEISNAAVMAVPCVVAGNGNRDGLPTVLLEAMALGTPCVATPVTGIREVVTDGHTGRLVPERSPEQLAQVLGALLDDADQRTQLATAARQRIETDFDGRATAERWRDVVLANGPAETTERRADADRLRVR